MYKYLTLLLFILTIASCRMNTHEKETSVISGINPYSSPTRDTCAEPFLFADSKGVVYLSWIEKKGKQHSLKFSTLANDKWSEPVTIGSGNNWFVNWADYPRVASDGTGNLMALYLEKSGDSKYAYDVKVTNSGNNGETWSTVKTLHDDGKLAEHGFVSAVPYNNDFFVSWLDGRNTGGEEADAGHEGHHGQMSLRGAVIDYQGNKKQEWELDNRVCDCCQTSAAITSNGPVVVYRNRSEDEIRDMAIVRYVNGAWTTPKIIFPDQWKIDGCPVNGPGAASIGNHLAVAWFSMPEKNGQVSVVFSEDGGATFTQPIRIDEGKAIGRVGVVMLDEQTAMVSWMEGSLIKAVKVSADGTKQTSIQVAASTGARSAGFPQMTRAGNKIYFAWTDEKERAIKMASLGL